MAKKKAPKENYLDYFIRDYNGEPVIKFNPELHLVFKREEMEELRPFIEFAERVANAWEKNDLTKADQRELKKLRDEVLTKRRQVLEEIW